MKKGKTKSAALEKLEKMVYKKETLELQELFRAAYRMKKAREAIEQKDQQAFAA